MSGDETPEDSPFGRIFRMALTPPTKEEIDAAEKKRLAELAGYHRKYNAFLPHLKDAQRSLREAAALDCGGSHFQKTQEHLAILVEEIETQLVRSPT